MSEPRVLNFYSSGVPQDAVFIGRPTEWGNPFVIGRDGDRDEVIRKHEEWVESRPELKERIVAELAGKDLVCYCAPKRCHGDTLRRIANGE